jgi:hypothetical protein
MTNIYEHDLIWAGIFGFCFTVEENLMYLEIIQEYRTAKGNAA